MKGCLTSLITREMKTKTTMGYHFTPTTMATFKKISVGKDVGKLESLPTRVTSCLLGNSRSMWGDAHNSLWL